MKRAKGIKIKDIVPGDGAVAERGKIVIAHFECFLNHGDKCYSTRDRGAPAQFELGKRRVFPAIEQGVVGMRVGGRRCITVSPHLTYGERKCFPNLPENAVLRYDVDLLRVSDQWDNSLSGCKWEFRMKLRRVLSRLRPLRFLKRWI